MTQPARIEQIEIFMDKDETDHFFYREVARRFPNTLRDDSEYEVKDITFASDHLFFTLGLKQ